MGQGFYEFTLNPYIESQTQRHHPFLGFWWNNGQNFVSNYLYSKFNKVFKFFVKKFVQK